MGYLHDPTVQQAMKKMRIDCVTPQGGCHETGSL